MILRINQTRSPVSGVSGQTSARPTFVLNLAPQLLGKDRYGLPKDE